MPEDRDIYPEGTEPGEAASDAAAEEAAAQRSTIRKVLGYTAIALLSFLGVVILLLVLFIGALQTNWGGTNFADFLVTLVNPYSEAKTEYSELRGNFITRIELRDLRMYRLDSIYVDTVYTDTSASPVVRMVPKDSIRSYQELAAFDTLIVDTLQLAVIDTFRIRYNLLGLLRGRVHFRDVYLANPVLRARQRADSTWDLVEPFGADTSEAKPGEARYTLIVDRLKITDAQLFAIYNPPDKDSVLQVENFNISAKDMVFARSVDARIDTLYARYMPPGFDYWADLNLGGEIVKGEVNLTGFELESPFSLVTAEGRLQLPSDEHEEVKGIDFNLRADPISFRDIRVFLPTLHPDRSALITLRATGSTRLMDIDAAADLSDGSSIRFNGSISPVTDGPVNYIGKAELRSISPSFFTGPNAPASTIINADLSLDLAGTQLERLDGAVSLDVFDSRVGGIPLEDLTASADFSEGEARIDARAAWNGSTITADGTIVPFQDVPTYVLSGRTSNFNIAGISASEWGSSINASFSLEGAGFDPAVADASVEVQLNRSTINNFQIDDGRMNVRLAAGNMSFGVRFLFPDGLLVANGRADLEDPIRYVVERGRFENVDLAALLGQEQSSSLNGRFELEGTGTDPLAMDLEASLAMTPSTYGHLQMDEGSITLDLENGRLAMNARAQFKEAGRFNFAAYTRPFDELPTFHVTRGEFTNVNVGALVNLADQDTDLSGTATFTSRGFDPETMVLNGRFQVSSSRVNEQQINTAMAAVDLRAGLLGFDVSVDIPEGDLKLAGSARPFRDSPTYEVSEGTFRNINLATFTGNPELDSNLNGSLAISGTGFDPETMSLEGRISMTPSRINEQQINAASINGTFHGGTLDATLTLDIPEGETRLAVVAQPFVEMPTYTVREGTLAGINVGALTGNSEWQTNLVGSISLTGRGIDPETMSAEGSLVLSQSQINDATVARGRINGSLDSGFLQFDANVVLADGSADVRGSGNIFADVPTYEAEGTLTNLSLDDVLGIDTLQARLSGDFQLEGTGTDPETMELRGRITAQDSFYDGSEVDTLFSQFYLNDGVLQVDSLFLRSSVVDASGSGIIAAFDTTTTSNFRFTADIKDLRPVRELVAAENLQLEAGHIEGRVYGRPGTLRFDVTGDIESLIYDDIRIAQFEGTMAGEIGPDRRLSVAEVGGEFSSISLPRFLVENADLDISYTTEGIAFNGSVVIDRNRTAEIAGRVETRLDARRILLQRLSLNLDSDRWELLQEASITYGEEYRVSNFLLHSEDQQIAVDGLVDPYGNQNLVLTIENFKIQSVADLLGYRGMQGVVTGALILSGPADSPNLSGSLSADLASFDQDVGDLRLTLDYRELRMNVNARLEHVDGSTFTARGYLPLDLRVTRMSERGLAGGMIDESVQFSVVADSFNVGWIDPFVDPEVISEFEGRLEGRFEVSGSVDQPIVDGAASFVQGRIGLPELGLTYRDIQATFALSQNDVEVSDLRIRSGDGNLTGSGTINLAELTLGEFNIDLTANNFLAINSTEYEFVIGGNLQLSGTTRLPIIQGDVDLVRGEIFVTDETTSPELELVQLSIQDIQTVEQRFGLHIEEADTTTFRLYNALAMDLDVRMDRDMWVRSSVNPVMNIQFEGDLDLSKEHMQDVQVFGTIEVVPQHSSIVQFGKRFHLSSGTLTFNGPPEDPHINFDAKYSVRTLPGSAEAAVAITLSVEGRMSDELDLTLGSENPGGLDQTNILSYLATGRPASESLHLGGTGQYIATEQISALITEIAASGLGLDLVTVDVDPFDQRLSLTAGEYLTSRLFISVSQPIGGESDATRNAGAGNTNLPLFTVEYELRDWLLLRLLQQSATVRLNLLWEYSY